MNRLAARLALLRSVIEIEEARERLGRLNQTEETDIPNTYMYDTEIGECKLKNLNSMKTLIYKNFPTNT